MADDWEQAEDKFGRLLKEVTAKTEELQRFLEVMTDGDREEFKSIIRLKDAPRRRKLKGTSEHYKRMVARARVLASYGDK